MHRSHDTSRSSSWEVVNSNIALKLKPILADDKVNILRGLRDDSTMTVAHSSMMSTTRSQGLLVEEVFPAGTGAASFLKSHVLDNQNLEEDRSTGIPVFPWQLHDMLDDASRLGFTDLVSWEDDGRSFKVHDKASFAAKVLPKYFHGQRQYKSFQRQLNMYGFKMLAWGPHKGAYTHALLERGNPDICRFMSRCKKPLQKTKIADDGVCRGGLSSKDAFKKKTNMSCEAKLGGIGCYSMSPSAAPISRRFVSCPNAYQHERVPKKGNHCLVFLSSQIKAFDDLVFPSQDDRLDAANSGVLKRSKQNGEADSQFFGIEHQRIDDPMFVRLFNLKDESGLSAAPPDCKSEEMMLFAPIELSARSESLLSLSDADADELMKSLSLPEF